MLPADRASQSGVSDDSGTTESLDELILACRVLHAAGLGFNVGGFVALRDAQGLGTWVTRDDAGFDEMGPDDLVLISAEGEKIRGRGDPDEEFDFARELFDARRDVNAAVHVHSLYTTAFAATDRCLQAISHEGCHLVPPEMTRTRWRSGFKGIRDEARELSSALGSRNSILLPGHGGLTVATTLGEAVALAVYLDKACQLQLLAGDDVHTVSDVEVIDKRNGQLARPRISWEYLVRSSAISSDERTL